MSNSTFMQEEPFFGFENESGVQEGFTGRQPSVEELERLSEKYPELFSRQCPECGGRSIIVRHIVRTDRLSRTVSQSFVEFLCPQCGHRYSCGANYQLAQMRISVLKSLGDSPSQKKF